MTAPDRFHSANLAIANTIRKSNFKGLFATDSLHP